LTEPMGAIRLGLAKYSATRSPREARMTHIKPASHKA
jgi:hypothetical protein